MMNAADADSLGREAEVSDHPNPSVIDTGELERARTQWQFGDWDSLARLDRDTLEHHPDRAKLALLAAAGRLQTDCRNEARQFLRFAQDWGISKKLISQILIAGVHNSLGRAAAASNDQDRAQLHFEKAIQIGTPGSAQKLITTARTKHELETLGLLPGSQGRLQQYQALSALARLGNAAPETKAPTLRSTSVAHTFYINLGRTEEKKAVPFLLIDSKSLPRSGLHYLKNTLSKVFGEYFSFCEWYQEPGCCKQSPCTYTGFASHAQETGSLRIRLLKSHDFALDDPIYPTSHHLRRLILVRDPLYILTSWFALDQLTAHKDLLAKNGIVINKIWLAHEKEVLKPAYQILDQHFNAPSAAALGNWLQQKTQYITGFMSKWVEPLGDQSSNGVQLVHYDQINAYIQELAEEYQPYVSPETAERIGKAARVTGQQFKKRSDAFSAPSERLGEYLTDNAMLFHQAAQSVLICDLK
ncbi:MAG TPA: hypothetical protein PLN31_05745 [Azoarcus taiwanensis]|nr:hypothetical protein [Azoarcus taiwanensis]